MNLEVKIKQIARYYKTFSSENLGETGEKSLSYVSKNSISLSESILAIIGSKDAGKTASREGNYASKNEIDYEKIAEDITNSFEDELSYIIKENEETNETEVHFKGRNEETIKKAEEYFNDLKKILNVNAFETGFDKKNNRNFIMIKDPQGSFFYKDSKELGFWNKISRKILGKSGYTATGIDHNILIYEDGTINTLLEYGGEELLGSKKEATQESLKKISRMHREKKTKLKLIHMIDGAKISPYVPSEEREDYIRQVSKYYKKIEKIINSQNEDRINIPSLTTHVVNKANLSIVQFLMENPDYIEKIKTPSMVEAPKDIKHLINNDFERYDDKTKKLVSSFIMGIRDTGIIQNNGMIIGDYKTIPRELRNERIVNAEEFDKLLKAFYINSFKLSAKDKEKVPEINEISEILVNGDLDDKIPEIKDKITLFLERINKEKNFKVEEIIAGIEEKGIEEIIKMPVRILKDDYIINNIQKYVDGNASNKLLEVIYNDFIRYIKDDKKEMKIIEEEFGRITGLRERVSWLLKREKEKNEIYKNKNSQEALINNIINYYKDTNASDHVIKALYEVLAKSEIESLNKAKEKLNHHIYKSFENLLKHGNKKIVFHKKMSEILEYSLDYLEKEGFVKRRIAEGYLRNHDIIINSLDELKIIKETEENKNNEITLTSDRDIDVKKILYEDLKKLQEIRNNIKNKGSSVSGLKKDFSQPEDLIISSELLNLSSKEGILKMLGSFELVWKKLMNYKELEEKYLDDIAKIHCIPFCFNEKLKAFFSDESRIIGNIAIDSTIETQEIIKKSKEEQEFLKDYDLYDKITLPNGDEVLLKEGSGKRYIIKNENNVLKEQTFFDALPENHVNLISRLTKN